MKNFSALILTLVFSALSYAAFGVDKTVVSCDYYYFSGENTPRPVGLQVTDPNGEWVYEGESIVFTALPPPGMIVKNWGKATKSSSASRDVDDRSTIDWIGSTAPTYTWTYNSTDNAFSYLVLDFAYIEFTVRFNSQGGGAVQDIRDQIYTSTITVPACTRTGYQFNHWTNEVGKVFTAGTYGGQAFWDTASKSYKSNLTAVWTANTYTIEFNGNGAASGSMDSMACTYDQSYRLKANDYVREGASFTGWNTSSDGKGSSYGEMADVRNLTTEQGGKVILYAQWETKTYTVTVSAAGNGTVNPSGSETYAYGTKLTLTATPNEGYDFAKWSDGVTDATREIEVRETATYTASFTNHVYTLTFNGNGGTPSEASRQVTYRNYIGDLPTASQHLMNLAGWWTDPNGGKQITAVDRYEWTMDVTLYAHWTKAEPMFVDVVCEPEDGGTVVGLQEEYAKGDEASLTAVPNAGYSFRDWNDGNVNPETNFIVNGNVELTAVFTGNVYQVQFLTAQAGVVVPEAIYVTFGSPYGELPRPQITDESLKFNNWTIFPGTTVVDAETIVNEPKDHYLMAGVERRQSYTIEYDGNGARGGKEMVPTLAYRDVGISLAPNTYEKTGNSFKGWALDDKATTPDYQDCQVVTNLAAAEKTSVKVYAVWQPHVYYVAFDGNGATHGSMGMQTFTYGEDHVLNENGYKRLDNWKFAGWSNVVNQVTYTNHADVADDLYLGPNATNTLYAVWTPPDFGPYSKAMHCTTLEWDASQVSKWAPFDDEGAGYGSSGSEVRIVNPKSSEDYLSASVSGSGTLTFRWRVIVSGTGAGLMDHFLRLTTEDGTVIDSRELIDGIDGWSEPVSISVDAEGLIRFSVDEVQSGDKEYTVCLDQVNWETAPEPGPEDAVKIEDVSVSDGKFVLSFPSDKKFDYNLLTNANLLIDGWGVMTNAAGTGKKITFEPMILPDQSQLFYKVETAQRK